MPLPHAPTTFADTATSHTAPRSSLGLKLRTVHSYLGVLIAPLILFLAVTGVIQVYGLHEASADYQPYPLIEKLGMLHKDQVFRLRGGHLGVAPLEHPDANAPTAAPATSPAPDQHQHHDGPHSNLATALLKAYFALVACFLVTSTLLGLWIAWRHPTRRLIYLVVFLTGAIAPGLLAALAT